MRILKNIKNFVKWAIFPPTHIRNGYWLIGLLVLADQLSKLWIVHFIPPRGFFVKIIPGFNLVFNENYGASFGFLAGFGGLANNIFIIVTLLIIIMLLNMIKAQQADNLSINHSVILPIMLIISGAIGNLLDRISRGAVVDFLDFYIGAAHWPAFNLADSFISIGACLWLRYEWLNRHQERETPKT